MVIALICPEVSSLPTICKEPYTWWPWPICTVAGCPIWPAAAPSGWDFQASTCCWWLATLLQISSRPDSHTSSCSPSSSQLLSSPIYLPLLQLHNVSHQLEPLLLHVKKWTRLRSWRMKIWSWRSYMLASFSWTRVHRCRREERAVKKVCKYKIYVPVPCILHLKCSNVRFSTHFFLHQ